jgi:acetyltransferase
MCPRRMKRQSRSALVRLAQLAADLPEVREIDLNPLIADENGVMALDARVSVAKVDTDERKHGHPRFAIRPYPKEWERTIEFGKASRSWCVPCAPKMKPIFQRFFPRVNEEDLRLRFFAAVSDFSHSFIARLTQIDYTRTWHLSRSTKPANWPASSGCIRMPIMTSGEYAILLRSDLKGRGLGWKMMELIIEYARRRDCRKLKAKCSPTIAPCSKCARSSDFPSSAMPTTTTSGMCA